ncbi:hypothetical protein ANCDUO_06006 [Ancylostoma duodenale]|uniref:Uncharacterized protein n=1 Tax=Ancylostoma duodenale TaxID=51022 RepID=A0A0C2H2L7_9BILA|nr:hypothetical protein ANCDUO_06006 [Ancylostoma duodenale]
MAQRVERSRHVALSLKQGYEDNQNRFSPQWKEATLTTRTILQNSDNHNRLKLDEEQKNQVQNGKEKVQKKREPICHNCKK